MWFSVGSAGCGQAVTGPALVKLGVAWVPVVQDLVPLWFKCKAYWCGLMAPVQHWHSCGSVCGSVVVHLVEA